MTVAQFAAGVLTVDPDGVLGVVDGLGAEGTLGLGAAAIFGSLELLGVLGAENDGLEIVTVYYAKGKEKFATPLGNSTLMEKLLAFLSV